MDLKKSWACGTDAVHTYVRMVPYVKIINHNHCSREDREFWLKNSVKFFELAHSTLKIKVQFYYFLNWTFFEPQNPSHKKAP